MITRDGVAGLAGLAGALLLLWASRGLPQPALVPIGPAFYPRIVLTIIALLSAALLIGDLLGVRRVAAANAPAHYRLVVLAFVIFTGYVGLLPVLGYRAATFLFVGALQVALEPPRGRRWALVLAVALGTALVTYGVFEHYLSVLLPRGRLTGF
jgi:putative tricarboxylic transport membrane protein